MSGDCCVDACVRPCDYCSCEKKCSEMPSATTPIYGHIKAREVRIEQLDFGYTVRVGCQTFAIQDLGTVLSMLSTYLEQPEEVEALWRSGQLKF